MIWFLSIFIIMADGTATSEIHFSNDPKYNNEADCKAVGGQTINEVQANLGDKGKVYYNCSGISMEDLKKALVTGQGM